MLSRTTMKSIYVMLCFLIVAPGLLAQDGIATLISIDNEAAKQIDQGNYREGARLYEKALALAEQLVGPNHIRTATALNNLAIVYKMQGQSSKAVPLHQRCLRIRESLLGSNHRDVAASLNNLANVYQDQGLFAQAEPLYQRCVRIIEQNNGPDDLVVAAAVNNLAELYRRQERYKDAEPLYQRSLKIREQKLGAKHPDVAFTMNNLAVLYLLDKRYPEAETFGQRSLKMSEELLGPDHPDVATALLTVGHIYKHQGRYEDAETMLRRCLRIREDRLGIDHPFTATTIFGLGMLEAEQQKWSTAAIQFDRSRRSTRRYIVGALPALTEVEQLAFLRNNDQSTLRVILTLALAAPDNAPVRERTAAWLLNSKAVAQEALAERARLACQTSDPATRDLANQTRSVRRQLANLSLSPAKSGQETSRQQRMQQLSSQLQDLERRLGQATGQVVRSDPWVETKDIRNALSADSMFLDIARFPIYDYKQRKLQKAHYVVWLVPPAGKGDVKLFDLGDAEPIDIAIREARKALQAGPGLVRERGEPDAEREVRKPLSQLADLLLPAELRRLLDPAKQWLISPDGDLWLVPWGALPLDANRYAVEGHTLQFLISGRDLVRTPPKAPSRRPPLILADPDFDVRAGGERVDATDGASEVRGLASAQQLPRVRRLPGTAAEALAVQPFLERYVDDKVWSYQGSKATEGIFKSFQRPKALVVSTHGFFLADQDVAADQGSASEKSARPTINKDDMTLENPLLRCGLLLAGCNQRDAAQRDDIEDGVLTGLEIAGTDLRGTELVVLSACETGLGEVHNGEGVAGLRQAFQLAGAHAVIATLWQIPDRDSALLMEGLFERLARGESRAEALCSAQRARIEARRSRNGRAHPFFWAAYTLTGQ